ncbi:MAG: ABC transporter permease [Candidatus Sumerlaeota bacterium]|nr:ABC transporter permease [Candidatus Sumerlaeota bacterium]
MKTIAAIAWNTFREAVRSRILYLILIFALLLMASSGIVRDLSIAAHDRVVRDFGLLCINLFGLAVAILVGIGSVYNELDKKSIYTIVSKPIARWQFLLGKYFGLLLTIYVIIFIMTVFFLMVLNYQDMTSEDALIQMMKERGLTELTTGVHLRHDAASAVKAAGKGFLNLVGVDLIGSTRHITTIVLLTALELAVVTAFAILYSSFSTPTLSAIFTLLTFVAGRLNESIWEYSQQILTGQAGAGVATVGGIVKHWLVVLAYMVTPNLGAFRVNTLDLADGAPLSIPWFTVPYGVLYAAMVLSLSIMIFRSRNFK